MKAGTLVAILALGTDCFGGTASAQEPTADYAPRVNQLVEQLRGLAANPSRDEFLNRTAMDQLMAMGYNAYATLKDIFLRDEDWSIKISAGYLVILLDNGADHQTRTRLISLMKDENALVRSMAASLCMNIPIGQGLGEAWRVLSVNDTRPSEEIGEEQSRWQPSIVWISDGAFRGLIESSLSIVDRGKPLLEPPQWSELGGGRTTDRNPMSVRLAGTRALTDAQAMVEHILIQALDSQRAHQVVEPLMTGLELDDATDQARLGRRFLLAELALGHTGPCRGGKCELRKDLAERLLNICEKWTWTVKDPSALYSIISALQDLAVRGVEGAKELLEQLKARHPNGEVQEVAALMLTDIANRVADRDEVRDRQKAHEEYLKQKREAWRAAHPPKPKLNPPSTPRPPGSEPAPAPYRTGPFIIGGAVGLAVLLAVWVYFKTRARATT